MSSLPVYEARPCATLGTHWVDIYRDGELFAMQVDAQVATWAIGEHPEVFSGWVSAPVAMLRRRALEEDYLSYQRTCMARLERGEI